MPLMAQHILINLLWIRQVRSVLPFFSRTMKLRVLPICKFDKSTLQFLQVIWYQHFRLVWIESEPMFHQGQERVSFFRHLLFSVDRSATLRFRFPPFIVGIAIVIVQEPFKEYLHPEVLGWQAKRNLEQQSSSTLVAYCQISLADWNCRLEPSEAEACYSHFSTAITVIAVTIKPLHFAAI